MKFSQTFFSLEYISINEIINFIFLIFIACSCFNILLKKTAIFKKKNSTTFDILGMHAKMVTFFRLKAQVLQICLQFTYFNKKKRSNVVENSAVMKSVIKNGKSSREVGRLDGS